MERKPSLTIKEDGTNELDIKKSKFICNIRRIKDEDDAKRLLSEITTIHAKATHNCYAYMTGDQDQIQRESDNGEPSGTAGVPILEVLKKNELHNVLAVVTRYFGGIKLGAGGLIRAYSNSASKAIEKVGIVDLVPQKQLIITVEYPLYDKLNYFLTENGYQIDEPSFTENVTLSVPVDETKIESFTADIKNLLADKFTLKIGDDVISEVPYSKN
ncbi:YigZ family protein [Lentilactobacillus sp. Marseille-Q4993]|uniref:YigZ family protein n=1 Tax=Lentilactobacillus sp. Marseille-Q4993 TaxID=3039492 RepID=UPI0024BCAE9C|nr:YigZ family protein [Lentilactobacillus sp. Marseille-Q4993]